MTDSLWRTDQSSLVYAVDDGDQVVQSRDEVRCLSAVMLHRA